MATKSKTEVPKTSPPKKYYIGCIADDGEFRIDMSYPDFYPNEEKIIKDLENVTGEVLTDINYCLISEDLTEIKKFKFNLKLEYI